MSADPFPLFDGVAERAGLALIASIKARHIAVGGRQACCTQTCLNVATERVFWPGGPAADYPVYCPPCAAWAKRIMQLLGLKPASEPLPAPPDDRPDRAISFPE